MAFDFDDIRQEIRKLRKHLKHWPKHATPRQVHSLRTTIRRLENAFRALDLDSKHREQQLLRKLEKLRRRAGKVRDLDVLTSFVATLKVNEQEQECRVQLLEYLGAQHACCSQRLHSFAARHHESLRLQLKRTAAHLQTSRTDSTSAQGAPGYAMLPEVRLQRDMARPLRLTEANLHPYRLQVKQLRDMLQLEKHPADRKLIQTLGRLKDVIGEWHDWQQLLKIAGENLHHASKCHLIAELRTITRQKLRHALAVTNAGRKQIQSSPAGSSKCA